MYFLRHIVLAFSSVVFVLKLVFFAQAQLSPTFYDKTCPNVTSVIKDILLNAISKDPKITAKLVRAHFHDCFVQGCDASVLLDDPATTEKQALPNLSLGGHELIDEMKKALENVCPQTVSCADILTIAAKESVSVSGGPTWVVPLGRQDSRSANRNLAGTALPGSGEPLEDIKAKFKAVGLDTTVDLVALSGAHTFGVAQCFTFDQRLYNFTGAGDQDPDLSEALAAKLRTICPAPRIKSVTSLDHTTPDAFDNAYFKNLLAKEGLLRSDQALFSAKGSDTVEIVNQFSTNQAAFFDAFAKSMIRMGNIKPPTSVEGEVRLNCRVVNTKNIEKITSSPKNAKLVRSI